jgi:hypothetical protein
MWCQQRGIGHRRHCGRRQDLDASIRRRTQEILVAGDQHLGLTIHGQL